MTNLKKTTRPAIQKELVRLFFAEVFPILEEHGFRESPFKDHYWGNEQGNSDFEFCALTKEGVLEMFEIYLWRHDSNIHLSYCRYGITPKIDSLSALTDKYSIKLVLFPRNKQWIDFHRYAKIPFIRYWSILYKVKVKKNNIVKTEKSIRKVINMLKEDLSDFDQIRRRWEASKAIEFVNLDDLLTLPEEE